MTVRNLVNKLELPTDVLLNDTNVEIIGRNCIFIENYRRIITFDEKSVVIMCKHYRLNICGVNLCIEYYNEYELKISGGISEITFC